MQGLTPPGELPHQPILGPRTCRGEAESSTSLQDVAVVTSVHAHLVLAQLCNCLVVALLASFSPSLILGLSCSLSNEKVWLTVHYRGNCQIPEKDLLREDLKDRKLWA